MTSEGSRRCGRSIGATLPLNLRHGSDDAGEHDEFPPCEGLLGDSIHAMRDEMQVRAAYRVLTAYHDRLFATLRHLRARLSERFGPLEHSWWDAWHPIDEDKDPLVHDVSFVDLLPRACFLWQYGAKAGPGSYQIYVKHTGDTGSETHAGEATTRWPPVDATRSTLHCWFHAVGTSPGDGVSFESWDDVSVDDQEPAHWQDETCRTALCYGAEVRYGGLARDVAKLATREAVEENLVAPLMKLLEEALAGT